MLDLQTKCCPRPSASGNILSSGPTYHMLPSTPVNNCIMHSLRGRILPFCCCNVFSLLFVLSDPNRPYPVIWKTVPIRMNILKLHQVNFCIENIILSKFHGDTRYSFPDIAFRIYINSYEKLAICTSVGTKYCILPTLSQRVLYLKTL